MRWLRDPLVVFLGVGALMFLAASHFSDEEISYVVELDEEDVERISDKWATQMRRPPSEQELSELVADFVKDEIYYREAQRLSLNANDSIVRARMIQKLTFLTDDIATGVSLSDEALRQYYSENEKDYAVPQRYSFSHRYFSTDKRTDPQRDAMKAIVSGEKGDLFLAGHNYFEQTQVQIRKVFGEDFAIGLSKLSPKQEFQGPIESAYGWHIIRLESLTESFTPQFESVANRVLSDAKQAMRTSANQVYYDALMTKYQIKYPSLKR